MDGMQLSPLGQKFLAKIRKKGVLLCALECIGKRVAAKDKANWGKILKKELDKLLNGIPPQIYLKESTANHANPLKSAIKAIEKGYPSQGLRIKLETPMNWQKYSDKSRNTRYKVQAWVAMDAVLTYDSLTNNDDMFCLSFAYITDWVNCFIIGDMVDDFSWYDMAVGQRSTKLSYVIRRAIENNEKIEDIAAMIVTAEVHIRDLMYGKKVAVHSNHGLFQMAGLLSLAKLLPFMTSSKKASDFAMEKIKSMLENHFAEDFLHKEHSPMYHIYMANYVSLILDSGFMADSQDFIKLAKGAIEASKWFAKPDGMILPFGDTPNIPILDRTHFPLSKYRNRAVSPPGLKYFEKGGLVIHSHYSKSKKPHGYLAFNGGFHSRQHKHADDLNIQLFNNGVDILVDPGTFTYQYNLPERMYIESTRAHNCLEIDGLNYSRYRKDAFGNAIHSVLEVGECIVIEAEVDRERLVSPNVPNNKVKNEDAVDVDISHTRKIVYHPENFLLVIDLLSSKQVHAYRQWYKINPELTLEIEGVELFLSSKSGTPIAKIQNLYPIESTIDVFSGVSKPQLQGWTSLDGHTLEKTNSICIKSEGDRCIMATVFDLNPTDQATYFFNEGTGGKYLRFSLKRSSSKYEFISRTKGESSEITFINNDLENKVSK